MKVRKGFVTNSSSTSYVIVGVPVEHDKIAGLSDDDIPHFCRAYARMFDYSSAWCTIAMGTDITPFWPGDEIHRIITTFLDEYKKYPCIVSGLTLDVTIGILEEGRSVSKDAVARVIEMHPSDKYLHFDTGSLDNNSTNTADEFVEHYTHRYANFEFYTALRETGMEPPDALKLAMEHNGLVKALRGMGSSETDAVHIALKEIGHEDSKRVRD